MFPVPGKGPRILAPLSGVPVNTYFDRFPVKDAVAAVDAFPRADGAQLSCWDRGLGDQAVQILVGDEPRMAAARGVRGGGAVEVVGFPGKHAFLAVESLAGVHDDEGGERVLTVFCGLIAAHRS